VSGQLHVRFPDFAAVASFVSFTTVSVLSSLSLSE